MPKNAFFDPFFQNFACGAKKLAKIDTKPCFGRARKINLVDLKKKKSRQNFRNFFENPPPPRENPKSAPELINFWKVFLKVSSSLLVFLSCLKLFTNFWIVLSSIFFMFCRFLFEYFQKFAAASFSSFDYFLTIMRSTIFSLFFVFFESRTLFIFCLR